MNRINKYFLLMIVCGFICMNHAIGQQEFNDETVEIQIQELSEIQIQYDALQKMYETLIAMSIKIRSLKIQYDSSETIDEGLKNKMIQMSARYLALKKLYEDRLRIYNNLLAEQQVDVEDEFGGNGIDLVF